MKMVSKLFAPKLLKSVELQLSKI